MSKSRTYCHVCAHYIRGSQAVHNQTLAHRKKANPVHHVTKKALRAKHRRDIRGRKQEDDYVSVKKYNRSRPRDGARKVVRVRHYWRSLMGTRR